MIWGCYFVSYNLGRFKKIKENDDIKQKTQLELRAFKRDLIFSNEHNGNNSTIITSPNLERKSSIEI